LIIITHRPTVRSQPRPKLPRIRARRVRERRSTDTHE
jgi:hypothetical protein